MYWKSLLRHRTDWRNASFHFGLPRQLVFALGNLEREGTGSEMFEQALVWPAGDSPQYNRLPVLGLHLEIVASTKPHLLPQNCGEDDLSIL
jgi:hypothetical protein